MCVTKSPNDKPRTASRVSVLGNVVSNPLKEDTSVGVFLAMMLHAVLKSHLILLWRRGRGKRNYWEFLIQKQTVMTERRCLLNASHLHDLEGDYGSNVS